METYNVIWDPLRRKHVARTPEENVRQWIIGFLNREMHVPMHMMMSEASIMLGRKKYRTDVLIYDRNASPLAVVECKRPEVRLDNSVLEQAVRYNMVLNVRYIMITNGYSTCIFKRREDGDGMSYSIMEHAPLYEEMLKGEK